MATALVSGVSGNAMSKKEDGPLKTLMEYIVAHLFQGQPTPDQSDRALRAVSGQLGRNAPFVEATFLPLRGASGSVKAVAISPKGKIAIVLWRSVGKDDFDELCLVVWEDGNVSRPKVVGTAKTIDEDDRIRVFFPEGSEEPAICVRDRVVWGKWEEKLPWPEGAPADACLTLWEEFDASGPPRRFLAYIHEGAAVLFPIPVSGRPSGGGTGALRGGTTRWMGLVEGDLARITAQRGVEVLRWRELVVPAPTRVPTVDAILPGSIGFKNGGVQFVATVGNSHVAVWSDGTTRHEATAPQDVFFDQGKIYGIGPRGTGNKQILRFEKDRFVPVGNETDLLPAIEPGMAVHAFGSTVVVSNFNLPAKVVERRTCVITPGHGAIAPNSKEHLALRRLHEGVAAHRRDGTFHWNIPTAADVHTAYADFPLYGLPFDRLRETEDDRGKAIMSWAFADGTFHVLRYPLPR